MGRRGYSRISAVNELVRQEVSDILLTQSTDPRLSQVSVTRVESTADLGIARVYYRVFESRRGAGRAEVEEALGHARGFVQRLFSPRVHLKHAPVLEFFYDDSVEKQAAIERKLKEISGEDDES